MNLIKRIPWKALLIFAIGIVIGYYFGGNNATRTAIKVNESTLKTTGVAEKVNKPTNHNETKIDFNDNKFKKTDSLKIILSQEPKTKQEIIQVVDSCAISKKAFLKLSNSLKRKLNRALEKQ